MKKKYWEDYEIQNPDGSWTTVADLFSLQQKELIDYILIWMEAHDRQNKDFDTDSLIKYLKEQTL